MLPRPIIALLLAAAAASAPLPASAQFIGDLAFTPDACKAKRECILRNALEFVDPDKRLWRAEAGDLTDGASIPDWAQGFIGDPWDETYLKAAVLHDHYCVNHITSWRDTHLMFYNALLDLGVSSFKAKVMYYAVYLGGPRWIDVLAPVGETALKVVKTVMRPAIYDRMDMHNEMNAAGAMMAIKPDASLADLERMAQEKHPDLFDKFGGGILEEVAARRGVQ